MSVKEKKRKGELCPAAKSVAGLFDKKKPIKRLVMSVSNKGNIGKSFITAHLTDWLRINFPDIKARFWDPDHANRTLCAYFPELAEEFDVLDSSSCDDIARCLADDADLSVCDGIGSHFEISFAKWIGEVSLFEIAAELGFRVTFVVVVDDSYDVLQHVAALERFKSHDCLDWLFIYNPYKSAGGSMWKGAKIRSEFLERGALEVDFPRSTDAVSALFTALRKTAWGLCSDDALGIDAFDRNRIISFSNKIDETIAKACPLILPYEFKG